MKRLFFFKSSPPISGNGHVSPPTDKQAYSENLPECGKHQSSSRVDKFSQRHNGFASKAQKPKLESQSSSPHLTRRSLSFSSAAFNLNDGLGQRNTLCLSDQSSSSSIPPHHLNNTSSRGLDPAAPHQHEKARSKSSPRSHDNSMGDSSLCSGNVSSTVLDLYIDGEQQQERYRPQNNSSQRIQTGTGNKNECGRQPPRVQYASPASPTNSIKGRQMSHSFRESTGNQTCFLSKDWAENEFRHDSSRKLAKHVIEKLSMPHHSMKTSSKDFDSDMPITVGEIYGGCWNKCSALTSVPLDHKNVTLNEPCEAGHEYQPKELVQKKKKNPGEGLDSADNNEDTDVELYRKFKEAKERALVFAEEFEQEDFLLNSGFDVPDLVQTVRHLTEERIYLAFEVSATLQGRMEDRSSAKDDLRLVKLELDTRTRRLEKEKNELRTRLEKELDRRSNDWSNKLEKYQSEEQRLCQRVRELAEQNVSLQREVSALHEKETESRSVMELSESQLRNLNLKLEEVNREKGDLQQNLFGLLEKYTVGEEERACIQRNFEEKAEECKELQKSITRFLRTYNEQEKTIAGLREGLSEEIEKQSDDTFDKHMRKLQMEQMRLTGVEQDLRREMESYRSEVDSLRHEKINLLSCLKISSNDGGFSTLKLDQELWNHIGCLQGQGLLLLSESTQLSSKLLEFIKEKAGNTFGTKQSVQAMNDGLDRQFVFESEVKVKGFKRGTENLARSLQLMTALLHEKHSKNGLESQSNCTNKVGSERPRNHDAEETLRYELKAEALLTRLLRDKLYSKEVDAEQLLAELATAVRGNDILRREVQNTKDTLSSTAHKLKDLEIQLLKKDDDINHLENDLQESAKELMIMKALLSKISEERDHIWEEVKQYSEKNMLLNSQVNVLKKRTEALDEDVLFKEGQISILKDALGNKTFELLTSP